MEVSKVVLMYIGSKEASMQYYNWTINGAVLVR